MILYITITNITMYDKKIIYYKDIILIIIFSLAQIVT